MKTKLIMWMFVLVMLVGVVSGECVPACETGYECNNGQCEASLDTLTSSDSTTSTGTNLGIGCISDNECGNNQFCNPTTNKCVPRSGGESTWSDIYTLARAGKFIAEKMNIKSFEFVEKFFESTFGRFITGEPSFGVCESNIRKSGNSDGVVMEIDGLQPVLIAHVEGERTEIVDPNGVKEYYYRITLQAKAQDSKEAVTYNVDLYDGEAKLKSVFKVDQKKNGTISYSGPGALAKYSNIYYDKVCLSSSIANVCNRIIDINQLARVIGQPIPETGTEGGLSSTAGGSSSTSETQTEW